jgi:O-antigen biosynthesis protein WbqP
LIAGQDTPRIVRRTRAAILLRIFDLVSSIFGLVVAAPVMLIAAVAVRIDSPGSAIFAQARVGRHRRVFICYKLRTMSSDTPQGGSHEIGCARITRAGRLLRRTKIDELPQLWNVLRGEMSLVGPRPCLPGMGELIAERDRLGVYTVRPGITGPAQIAGLDMSNPRALARADAEWLCRATPLNYLRTLALTLVGRGQGDAAVTSSFPIDSDGSVSPGAGAASVDVRPRLGQAEQDDTPDGNTRWPDGSCSPGFPGEDRTGF